MPGFASMDRPPDLLCVTRFVVCRLSFAVYRREEGWGCASTQNTDIVPHMETDLVDVYGTFRSVSYRG